MKTLSETNPYLQNKEKAKKSNIRSARTSCGVEGIVARLDVIIAIDTSRSDAILAKMKKQLKSN